MQSVEHQRRLAGTGHTGHTGHDPQRDINIDILEVVGLGTLNAEQP